MTSQVLLEKIELLPKQAREQLVAFLDSLLEPEQEEEELQEKEKLFLKKRLDEAKAHPEENISWEELQGQLVNGS